MANVPYGSMLSLITDDPGQRGELSSFRSAGSMVAGIFTGILVPVLVYDASNNLLGDRMFWFALILGGIGLLFFQFMIRTTEIRVDTEVKAGEDAPKFNVLVALKNFFRNRAAVGATLSAVATFIGMYGAQTATTVLFQAYFKNAQISGLVGMISYLGLFLFMPFVKNLVTKVGKKEGCTIGGCVTCLAYLLMFVAPITPDGKGLMWFVACQILAAVGNGFGTCVGYAMMADAMDYEEWKFGERNEGTTLRDALLLPQARAGRRPLARHRAGDDGRLRRHPRRGPARRGRAQHALPDPRHVPAGRCALCHQLRSDL